MVFITEAQTENDRTTSYLLSDFGIKQVSNVCFYFSRFFFLLPLYFFLFLFLSAKVLILFQFYANGILPFPLDQSLGFTRCKWGQGFGGEDPGALWGWAGEPAGVDSLTVSSYKIFVTVTNYLL